MPAVFFCSFQSSFNKKAVNCRQKKRKERSKTMKKHIEATCLALVFLFTFYVAADTFLIKESYQVAENSGSNTVTVKQTVTNSTTTDTSYEDDNISITINEYYENDTKIYVADVTVKNTDLLKTAFAEGSYGKNITEKTSEIAESVGAILAINGDYYGVQEKGYVLKNGVIYRNTAVSGRGDLVIYENGSFEIINESDVTLEELKERGAYNVLSFGPGLVTCGNVSVTTNQEVGRAMTSNPRTAIGIISQNHYVFVVSDGRTDESEGLSLYELATFMQSLGCETAYNLDGGGSSTMYFAGQVINNPTTNGNRISERSVSDIVYIGY